MAYIFSYTANGSPVSTCNMQPTTYGEVMYRMKELLKAAGWSVVRSGDGLSAFSGTTDVLSSASSGANGCNNPGAWFVAQMPTVAAATRQLLVFMGSTTTVMNRAGMRFVYSCSGSFTGGAANTRPNATDGIALNRNATGFVTNTDGASYLRPFGNSSNDDDTAFATNYNFSMGADDGSTAGAKYGFWLSAYQKGTGVRSGTIYIDPLASYDASDTDPFVVFGTFANGVQADMLASNMYADTIYYTPRAVFRKGSAQQAEILCPIMMPAIYQGNNIRYFAGNMPANPNSSKDELLPVFYGRTNNFTSSQGFKGTSSLLRLIGPARSTGDTYSVLSTRDRIVIGNFALPWNGSVPVV